MSYSTITPSIPNNYGLYAGQLYAFGASGGYNVTQGFSRIKERIPDLLTQYDVTDAIQLSFSARTLNSKLSIIKDSTNTRTVQAWYDNITDKLHYDSVKLCSCEFVNGINLNSIVSVGKLHNLYTDFQSCVLEYFGDPGGFASIFAGDQDFQVNGGVFDASALIQVLNSSTFNMQGSFVSDLSGDIVVNDINKHLEFVVDSNIFNNRNPSVHNWGVVDGFVAGDLVFVPTGFTITLSLDIETEIYSPVNNIGPDNLNAIRNRLNYTRGYVNRNTTYSLTNISQSTTLPILLILVDDTVDNYTNYGQSWNVSTATINYPNENWLNISLSSTGKYQTLISEAGNIFISNDSGHSWLQTFSYNNESVCNNVGISFTGMYQTTCNGHQVYVSSDYGNTWVLTFDGGTSNIFVSISLSGLHQTIVSSGDNLYRSSDYGMTWTPLDNDTELYNSIETFPTGGIALSYTGQYQTIVIEYIYISSDFGLTWTNVSNSNGFDERNWEGIAMSSDGKYQTAIENGGDVHISNDFGNSWIFVEDNALHDKNWQSVTVSATGQYQTVCEQNGNIYTSIDYGVTWTIVPDSSVSNKNWAVVTVSSDALYQVAIEQGAAGAVHVSQIFSPTNNPNAIQNCVCD